MDNPTDTVIGVVADWLNAVVRKEERRVERDVDHAVWETFPASDPISPYQAQSGDDPSRDLVMVLTADCIRITRGAPSGESADAAGTRHVIVGDTADGVAVRLEVRIDEDAVKKLPLRGRLAAMVKHADPALAAEAGRDPGEDAPKTPPEHA